ncbi:MAG: segregation/condensation protein A [Anaerolineae bacterium]|nr:segregation/condensation protein A [Anaerolineae bacterium]
MDQSTYQVRLPIFKGPLDLLLHLIEQQELDITAVSLAQVTDQYLDYLRIIENVRPDDLADFIVVAARLMLIKSRALLPQPPKIDEQDDDAGDDLIRQLVEYRRFKQIAQFLSQRDQAGAHMYPRTVPVSRLSQTWTPRLDLGETTLNDLVDALQSLLQQELETDPGLDVVLHTMTIEQKIEQIQASLQLNRVLTFHSLLTNARSKMEIVVTLLAVLEMIRARRIAVNQEHLFGEILISALVPASTTTAQ